MSVTFESKASEGTFDFELSEIILDVAASIFPNADDRLNTSFIFNDPFDVSKNHLYYCDKSRKLSLSSSHGNVHLKLEKFRGEAFMTRKIMLEDLPEQCVSTEAHSKSFQTTRFRYKKRKVLTNLDFITVIVGATLGVSAVLSFIYVMYLCRRNHG